MKDGVKYAASLVLLVLVCFALSWAAVYSYWFAAYWFHSVRAVRICESLGSIVLIPVRVAFWSFGDLFDQSAPLSDPVSYAATNGVILGIAIYSCARRWLFGNCDAGNSGRSTQ